MESSRAVFIKMILFLFFIWVVIPLCVMGLFENVPFDDVFSHSATSTWKEYSVGACGRGIRKKKCVWVSSITFKSKKALKLTLIKLRWRGDRVNKLFASLFHKRDNELTVVPIEENLVSDGIWDKKKQEITFNLDEKIVAVNKYYLVINFPYNCERALKEGFFVVSEKSSHEHNYQ